VANKDPPNFEEGEELQLFDFLTGEGSEYDLRKSPRNFNNNSGLRSSEALTVKTSLFVYFIGNFVPQNMEFETLLLFRHKWRDERLRFTNLTCMEVINGEDYFTSFIWTPNIFIENGRESTLMRTTGDSSYVRIFHTGEVELHYRLKTVVICDMQLNRFPHDIQNCTIKFESWNYPTSEIHLEWDTDSPIAHNTFHSAPEYKVMSIIPRQMTTVYGLPEHGIVWPVGDGFRKLNGQFSSLMVDLLLKREIGQYVLEYYIPSVLLVMMSWVSFWLDPSAVPGRTTLGTSTWLTLITITRNTGSDDLPKVNYVKFIDIWFLVCTFFIFFSLLEFAIVNTIWRRKDTIRMNKISHKSIIREGIKEFKRTAFSTPTISRRNSLDARRQSYEKENENQLTISSLDSKYLRVASTNDTSKESFGEEKENEITINVPSKKELERNRDLFTNVLKRLREGCLKEDLSTSTRENLSEGDELTHMSFEEIALYVDTKARILFPVLFLLFNIFYWILALDAAAYRYFIGECPMPDNVADLG